MQLGIEWTIKQEGQEERNYYTNTRSGEFALGYGDSVWTAISKTALSDAAEYGFIELVNSPMFQNLVKNSTTNISR